MLISTRGELCATVQCLLLWLLVHLVMAHPAVCDVSQTCATIALTYAIPFTRAASVVWAVAYSKVRTMQELPRLAGRAHVVTVV